MGNPNKETISTLNLARDIHSLCMELGKTKLSPEQKELLKKIDDTAFDIYTRPKVELMKAS